MCLCLTLNMHTTAYIIELTSVSLQHLHTYLRYAVANMYFPNPVKKSTLLNCYINKLFSNGTEHQAYEHERIVIQLAIVECNPPCKRD